ncbi:nuclear hormone receptor family member nhr-34-like [Penaeus japonicus]|uniref:nuclear hormone receptor family member nhr-34-like n=1 Tax=Penaeus japonicus TaxID=27405 RepID=UPI001C70E4DE|nr:nuclear hormone receptor family member nhr-34-like [Penaeus japonicus]
MDANKLRAGGLVNYVTDNSTRCSAVHKNRSHKVCGVCGDVAKSMHFGAICCDSCKAFFRRSVQSSMWETFICIKDGECEVTQNRRCCQACRFALCRKIGMDPSLVMSEEDRKLLMSRRLEKKRQQLLEHHRLKQLSVLGNTDRSEAESDMPEGGASSMSSVGLNEDMDVKWESNMGSDRYDSPLSAHVKDELKEEQMEEEELDVTDISPMVLDQIKMEQDRDERMDECRLPREDLERISMLQKLLRRGLTFPEFPKHYYEEDADVMEHLFFVFCKGMGNFFSLIPDFRELQAKDRSMLLKDAVSKAIFIFGAHQFQEDHESWPRKLLSTSCTFPKITMATVEKFLGDRDVFSRLKAFMHRFRPFFEDEVMTLLSLMVAAFDQQDSSFLVSTDVAERKEKYLRLLKDYVHQRSATVPEATIISELWTCFKDVQELVQCFKSTSSTEEEAPAHSTDERAFSSSLHDLGGDSRLPPKKAFHRKASKGNELDSQDVIFLEEVENTNTWEEPRSASDTPSRKHVTYQDHDYQRLCTFTPEPPVERRQTHVAPSILSTKEVDIIPLPPGFQPRYWSPREEASDTSLRNTSFRGHAVGGISLPLSKDVIRQSGSFARKLPPSSHYQSPLPQRAYQESSQSLLSLETYSPQPREPIPQDLYSFHPKWSSGPSQIYQSTYGLQPKSPHRKRDSLRPDLTTESSYQDQNYQPGGYQAGQSFRSESYACQEEPRPPSASSSTSSSSSSSRQSPMTHVCQGLNRLSANEDEQILQAIQGVLPPRLVTHLATRLASARRTRRDDL